MEFFDPHLEILPPAQIALWPELHSTAKLGYTLYGGTAIALRLGHRQSIDFDFFSAAPLDRMALSKALPFLQRSTVLQDRPDSLTVLSQLGGGDVKVSFFGTIDFGRVGEPATTRDGVLQVASLLDLLATKLKVTLQRVEAKDYIDIAAILASGASLPLGLAAARALYGKSFQPSESLKALVYFCGGDLGTLLDDDKNTLKDAVAQVREIPEIETLSPDLAPG